MLRQANQDCIDRTTPLLKMLGSCRNQFSLYAQSHKAKGTEDGDQKAATNESFVAQIDETLREFRERAPKDEPEFRNLAIEMVKETFPRNNEG